MADIPIKRMNFEQVKGKLQEVEDTIARMKRSYEDLLYNMDEDVDRLKVVSKNTKAEIKVMKEAISLFVDGEEYHTGINISPHEIRFVDGNRYVIISAAGMRFYDNDTSNQIEGWAIEPDGAYGGLLRYYINNAAAYGFGSGYNRRDGDDNLLYATTDMTLRALSSQRGRFVVDVTDSGYPQVLFVGLHTASNDATSPDIFANGLRLATQDWVTANAGSGVTSAVFG